MHSNNSLFERKNTFVRNRIGLFLSILLLFTGLLFVYRDVVFKGKIAFSSNLLYSYYSPWATQRDPEYPNGAPNKPIGGNDQVRMFYPYRTFINESISKGEFPLWNPYNFSGGPIIANFQSAVFYPLNILYFIMPQIDAWQLLVLLQPVLGTIFMYLYLSILVSRKSAAFLGSIAFGFSGYILAWSQENAVVGQAALWLPLVLYGAERFIREQKFRYFVILLCALSSSTFAGHLQTTFYIYFVSFLYGLYRFWEGDIKEWIKRSLLLSVAFGVSILVCAVQILPSLEAFSESTRNSSWSEPFLRYLMPVTHFINAMHPDLYGNPGAYNFYGRGFYQESIFYIGVIPFIFAVFASLYLRKDKIVSFFTWVVLISFFLGVDTPFTQWFFRLPILLVNTFTPSRIFFVTGSALAILACYGFNAWLEGSVFHTRRRLIGISFIFISILCGFLGYLYYSTFNQNSTIQSINDYLLTKNASIRMSNVLVSVKNAAIPLSMILSLVVLILVRKWITFVPYAVIVVVALGQFYFLNKYVVVGERRFLYPNHFVLDDMQKHTDESNRFLSFGLPILGNVALGSHLYSPDGIDPVFSSRYGQLVYASKIDGKFTFDIPRIEVNLSEYDVNLNIINNPRRQKLHSLLGVSRVYNYEKDYRNKDTIPLIFPPSVYEPLEKRGDWQFYANKNVLPRAFLVGEYIVQSDAQKNLDTIFDEKTDLRRTVVLEKVPAGYTAAVDGSMATADIVSYKPQEVTVSVKTDAPRLLFLSDVMYPGWRAWVGSSETEIYRANYAFRAVVVPSGEHTVSFRFISQPFLIGLYVSLGSLISVGSVFLYLFLKRRSLL